MSILQKFKENCKIYPNKKILKSNDKTLSFKEIDEYSDYVANLFSKKTSKSIIPIYINEDIYILPVILAILKAGKIVLPLTTSLSLKKSAERISDVDFDIIISDSLEFQLEKLEYQILDLPDLADRLDSPYLYSTDGKEDIYIICTSGTTGIPKKVILSEKNLIWLLEEFYKLVNFNEESKFLFTTPYTFDVSITEIFAPIFTGGELFCFDSKLSNTEKLKKLSKIIKNESVTHMSVSPSYAELLIDQEGVEAFIGLDFLCLAGENFSIKLGKKLKGLIKRNCRVFNFYGPTEATIYATFYELTGRERKFIPIGRPLPGATYCLKKNNKFNDKSGELYIGGSGVTKGYLNNSLENTKRFKRIENDIFYVTGDYVYHDSKKNIIFNCRKDDQVQVNGIRIELEEITAIVLNIRDIEACRTAYKNNRIYIFYKSTINLKSLIENNLPQYINPILVRVPEFLLNQNRKLDVQKMIDKFYLNSDNKEKDDLKSKILELLKNYMVVKISDLDSLDIVRFFLDVESEFKISIDDRYIIELKEIDKLTNYILNYEGFTSKVENKYLPMSNNMENDFINLQLMLNKNYDDMDFEEGEIETLLHQKNYDMKTYNSILTFECILPGSNILEIEKLKYKIIKLAKQVDIFRMVLLKNTNLYFRKLKLDRFSPVVLACDEFIEDGKIAEILYKKYGTLLFIVLVSRRERKAKFYFTHHIMDKSSLNMLENIIYNIINNDSFNVEIPKSYEDYIKYIKTASKNIPEKQILDLIPTAEMDLNIKKSPTKFYLASFESYEKTTEEITILSIFLLNQCIFQDFDINRITGYFIGNNRKFVNFDATKTIGDLHSSIDFEIDRKDSKETFKHKILERISMYEKGLHIYDNIFDGYPNFEGIRGQALKKASTRNIIFNYLGEVKNVEKFIKELKAAAYAEKYFVAFTNSGKIYILTSGKIFNQEIYCILIDELEIKLKIKEC